MPRLLLKKLGELLLPERLSDNRMRDLEPLDALLLVYQQNSRLAEQIESHAELAPYPQVAQRLRRIADEKRDVGNRLRKSIEDLHGSIGEATQDLLNSFPRTGQIGRHRNGKRRVEPMSQAKFREPQVQHDCRHAHRSGDSDR